MIFLTLPISDNVLHTYYGGLSKKVVSTVSANIYQVKNETSFKTQDFSSRL